MTLIYYIGNAIAALTCLTLVRGIPYQCPPKCSCNETIVKCIKKELNSVPDLNRLSFNPNTIDLSENNIEQILEHHFFSRHLKELKYLQLNDNNIFNVHRTAFLELPEIEYIDLSENQLDDMASDIIEKNTKLLELNLSNNLFGSNTPTIVSKSLLILDLSSNKLNTFNEDNFKSMPNLQALYLHVNNLQHLDYHMFRHVNLKFLDIAYNPWKCHCDTIKLFDHLVKFGLVAINSNVQCLHSNKLFEDIYGNAGAINDQFCNKRSAHKTDIRRPSGNTELEVNKENNRGNVHSKENVIQFIMHYEVLIIVGIVSVLLVVSLITLAVVVRSTTPNQRLVYGKIPT